MTINFTVGHLTDVGKAREANEDNYAIPPENLPQVAIDQKGLLYFVADGMGGHKGGQHASSLAKQLVMDAYYQAPSQDIRQSLDYAIRAANAEIHRQSQTNPIYHGMGTTIVAVVVHGNRLVIAHVGDSRAYLIRQGAIQQLTPDHSFIAEGLRDGTITPDEVNTHPYRGVITRALGGKADVQPDFREIPLHQDDAILLCSDGLSNMVGDQEMLALVERNGSAQGTVQELVDLANQRGGLDNITAIVLSWRRGAVAAKKSAAILPFAAVGALAVIALITIFVMWPKGVNRQPAPVPKVAPTSLTTASDAETVTVGVGATKGEPEVNPTANVGGTATIQTGEPTAEPTGGDTGNGTVTNQPKQATTLTITPESATPASTPAPVTPPQPKTPAATPTPPVSLPAPSLIDPHDGDTRTERIKFKWSFVTGAVNYRLETKSDREGQTDWRT